MMNIINSLEDATKKKEIHVAHEIIMKSGVYSEGGYVREFETLAAGLAGCADSTALAFNSAGSGLFSIANYWFHKLSKPSPVVAVQNNTFFATGAMMVEAGFQVALVDSREDDPSMSIDSLKELHKKMPLDVVVLTHVGGMIAKDYEAIAEYCANTQLVLLEDAAHAVGSVSDIGVKAGTYAPAVFSFYPTKAVPIGEGGIVTVPPDLPELHDYLSSFRNYGKSKTETGTITYTRGFNLRMGEWAAAVGCTQLKYLAHIIRSRQQDVARLESIIPSLFPQRSTNGYKYMIPITSGVREVGAVYRPSDQLYKALPTSIRMVSLDHSIKWSESHQCVPLGEGVYTPYTDADIKDYINLR